jgi:hypothetical protein
VPSPLDLPLSRMSGLNVLSRFPMAQNLLRTESHYCSSDFRVSPQSVIGYLSAASPAFCLNATAPAWMVARASNGIECIRVSAR